MSEIVEVSSVAALTRAELDQAVSTAKAYPRSIAKFKAEAMAMATLDQDTAASCFYSLPRGGKAIEGPSIRLAEIVGSAWGNLNYGARVIDIGDKLLTAQGICRDLERNVTMTAEVKRRITDKNGKRYSEDMIVVTANAACSIALRNAIFKVVPMAYAKDILAQARRVAIGDAKTLGARRGAMVEYFGKMGVEPKRICWLLGKPSIEDINLDDLQVLVGLTTAIKDGEISVDEAFPARDPKEPEPEAPKSKAERAVEASKPATPEPEPTPEPTLVIAGMPYGTRLDIALTDAGFDRVLKRKALCDELGIQYADIEAAVKRNEPLSAEVLAKVKTRCDFNE